MNQNQSTSILGGDLSAWVTKNARPFNRDVKIFDLDEIRAFIKSHATVTIREEENEGTGEIYYRFNKNKLSEILTLVQTVNNRFGAKGQIPAYIQGLFIKLKDL